MVWDPKDPWSRKNDPLEDVLKQAQTQLRNFLPSGGFRNILIAGLLIFLVWQSAFIIGPDEEGVVKRFGIPVRTVGPGPHLKIPLVESVLQPKVAKLHRVEIGFRTDRQSRQQMIPQEALMLTGDMNILAIEFIVQYKIKEASDFLFNVADIHDTIGKAAEASMREVIGKSKIDEALTTGKAQIQQDTQDLLQKILDQYQTGVQIAAVQLQDVDPPEAVAAAFKDVTNAKEDREKLINQSIGYRNDILPKAKGEAAADRQPGQRLCPGALEPGARRGQPLSGHAKGIQPGPRYHQQAHLHRDDGRDLAENGEDHHRREGRRARAPLFTA